MREKGFTLIELLATVTIIAVLGAVLAGAGWRAYESVSLATSANNLRVLAAGGMSYLADNNGVYWPWKFTEANRDTVWWWGRETRASAVSAEGTRDFDPAKGPLGEYIPKGTRPDPSFAMDSAAFKPKYRSGYIGIGYNALLGGGMGEQYRSGSPAVAEAWKLVPQMQIADLSKVVVFFTSAQVNNFQKPASAKYPMIEEFYGIDEKEVTVHFRHRGKAMVSFASGNVGFLEIDESTRDSRLPKANVGRFAPVGSTAWLK